jgi:hypothetical protein
LALILAFDAAVLASAINATEAGNESVPVAPWLLTFGGRPGLVLLVAALVLAALFCFACRWRPITSGVLAFLGLGLLSTALTALQGAPSRNFYVAGTTLLGWLCGEALELRRARRDDPVARSSLAEAAAAGAFAATYLSAAISKLSAGGGGWASPETLQSLVLAQTPVSDHSLLSSYVTLVVTQPALAKTFAAATLLIQLLSPAWLLGRRLRMVWGTLFIAFHVNVFLLTGIQFVESCFIAALFSYPWALLTRASRAASQPIAPEPAVDRSLLAVPVILIALGLAALLIPPELRPDGDPYSAFKPSPSPEAGRPANRH